MAFRAGCPQGFGYSEGRHARPSAAATGRFPLLSAKKDPAGGDGKEEGGSEAKIGNGKKYDLKVADTLHLARFPVQIWLHARSLITNQVNFTSSPQG